MEREREEGEVFADGSTAWLAFRGVFCAVTHEGTRSHTQHPHESPHTVTQSTQFSLVYSQAAGGRRGADAESQEAKAKQRKKQVSHHKHTTWASHLNAMPHHTMPTDTHSLLPIHTPPQCPVISIPIEVRRHAPLLKSDTSPRWSFPRPPPRLSIRMFASSSLLLTGGSGLLAALVTLVAYLSFFASPTQVDAFFRWRVVRVICAGVDMGARHKAKRYFRVRRRTWIKPAGDGKDGRRKEGRKEEEELRVKTGGKGKVRLCGGGWVGGE